MQSIKRENNYHESTSARMGGPSGVGKAPLSDFSDGCRTALSIECKLFNDFFARSAFIRLKGEKSSSKCNFLPLCVVFSRPFFRSALLINLKWNSIVSKWRLACVSSANPFTSKWAQQTDWIAFLLFASRISPSRLHHLSYPSQSSFQLYGRRSPILSLNGEAIASAHFSSFLSFLAITSRIVEWVDDDEEEQLLVMHKVSDSRTFNFNSIFPSFSAESDEDMPSTPQQFP